MIVRSRTDPRHLYMDDFGIVKASYDLEYCVHGTDMRKESVTQASSC
jgi:hypothetical protein